MSLPHRLLQVVCAMVICFAYAKPTLATHLVGGEMTYIYVGTNSAGLQQFEVHCYIYRDCSSSNTNGTGFDASAAIAVYQGSNLITSVNAFLDPALVTDIIPQNPNNCAFLPDDLCIERAEYIVTISLSPSQQPYVISHQRCCRSPAITNLNNPQDQGFTLTTMIPGNLINIGPNSTPIFEELPQAFVCNNYPFSLDNSAFDSDGDSLSYMLCPIYLGGSYIAPTPNPPTGPPYSVVGWAAGFNNTIPLGPAAGFSINPSTGLLTGTPNLVGKFALGICVLEWRNGQQIGSILRDFTLDVVTCNILAPSYVPPAPCTGLTAQFNQTSTPSESYDWDFGVSGTDEDTSNDAEPSYTYDEAGIYEVSLYFQTGTCADSLFFEVVAMEPWTTEFVIDDLHCSNGGWEGSLVIDTVDWSPEIEWEWMFGVNSIPPNATGSHPDEIWFPSNESIHVTLESEAFGCINNFDEWLDFPALPLASFEIDSDPCTGLQVAFDNLSPESGPFSWDFGGGAGLLNSEVSPVFTYPAYGTYNVTLTAGVGSECADSQSLEVTVLPVNPFDSTFVIQPISFCDSTGFVLMQYLGGGADEITWDFPNFFEEEGPVVQGYFPTVGLYPGTITLYNAFCDITSSFDIEANVPEPMEGVEYVVPNVFSPNNDSKNDAFTVAIQSADGSGFVSVDPGQFLAYDLQVYNRWGNAVFTSKQAGAGWRADHHPEGTYYILFKAQHVCDSELFEYEGEVTLVR
ncbi:MAG: PKD domain-containing protein [Flavobacteriales bacterium]